MDDSNLWICVRTSQGTEFSYHGKAHPHLLKHRKHIMPYFTNMMCLLLINMKRADPKVSPNIFGSKAGDLPTYFWLSSTATATETVMPTMGLLPAPRKPIFSTWAGTEEEPAN